MVFQSYGPDDLLDLAGRRCDQAMVAVNGAVSGVALPNWVQGGAILTTQDARRLAAQMLVAADEHDAIQDAAFGLPDAEPEESPQADDVNLGDVLGKGAFGLHDGDPGARDAVARLQDALGRAREVMDVIGVRSTAHHVLRLAVEDFLDDLDTRR